jgi:D-aminoacyl-tRNA deacylase
MILLVHSALDIAGTNIAKHVLQRHTFTQTGDNFEGSHVYQAEMGDNHVTYLTLKGESVHAQTLPESFPEAELVVFLSRHSSQSGTPTLSVHTPGNLGKADLGGLPRTVSIASAAAMQTALKALSRLKQEQQLAYAVSYEGTHHGPSLNVPTMFVELGSSEAQWRDETAAAAVAQAAMEAVADFGRLPIAAALGLGGTHYNAKFTQMALQGEAAFGHMVPKYAIPEFDLEMLQQCLSRTQGPVESAVLDWKGIKSEDKPALLDALAEVGLPFKKV